MAEAHRHGVDGDERHVASESENIQKDVEELCTHTAVPKEGIHAVEKP
jgi:hypothetical protein